MGYNPHKHWLSFRVASAVTVKVTVILVALPIVAMPIYSSLATPAAKGEFLRNSGPPL
jgi:uncharacterized membrane protein